MNLNAFPVVNDTYKIRNSFRQKTFSNWFFLHFTKIDATTFNLISNVSQEAFENEKMVVNPIRNIASEHLSYWSYSGEAIMIVEDVSYGDYGRCYQS